MDLRADDKIEATNPEIGHAIVPAQQLIRVHKKQAKIVRRQWNRAKRVAQQFNETFLKRIRAKCVAALRMEAPKIAPFMRVVVEVIPEDEDLNFNVLPKPRTRLRVYRDGQLLFDSDKREAREN
ncbi:MAG: hypothetical protein ABEN55_00255 [Bradymonadaceae bacterium]